LRTPELFFIAQPNEHQRRISLTQLAFWLGGSLYVVQARKPLQKI